MLFLLRNCTKEIFMTELEAVIKALKQLGGEAHYKEIAKIVSKLLPLAKTNNMEADVRRTLYTYCSESTHFKSGTADIFYSKDGISNRTGIFGLNNYEITYKNMGGSQDDSSFSEGRIYATKHYVRERNQKLREKAKQHFKNEHNGKLYCEICGFDFSKHYGKLGENFIEVHHTKPVSKMKPGERTKISDLVMVCSNCHSMIHRKKPWLSKKQLKNIYK